MVDIAHRKIALIRNITAFTEEQQVAAVEATIAKVMGSVDKLARYRRPLAAETDIQMIKKRSGYQGFSNKRWLQHIELLNIQESAEELISQLTA